jgi:5-bromo-4-chloroindolyl phosphate hydrolysis protein
MSRAKRKRKAANAKRQIKRLEKTLATLDAIEMLRGMLGVAATREMFVAMQQRAPKTQAGDT